MSKSKARILFNLSGSIACYKACEVVSQLVQKDCEVKIACTPAALNFVGRATLEGLTGQPVFDGLFTPGAAMEHINLNKWADLCVLCPATADVLNKMAAGLGDDAVTALFLAFDFKKPYLVAPAMNQAMWAHPATKRSLETLRGWGVDVIAPGTGRQACGDVGQGRMAEPEDVLAAITWRLEKA